MADRCNCDLKKKTKVKSKEYSTEKQRLHKIRRLHRRRMLAGYHFDYYGEQLLLMIRLGRFKKDFIYKKLDIFYYHQTGIMRILSVTSFFFCANILILLLLCLSSVLLWHRYERNNLAVNNVLLKTIIYLRLFDIKK